MELCQSKSNTLLAPLSAPETPLHSTSHASLTVGTLSPDSTHAKQHQHNSPQEAMPDKQTHRTDQEHQPGQQLKLKRVLRGDATRSYIMRPGSNSWTAVSQVCLQQQLVGWHQPQQSLCAACHARSMHILLLLVWQGCAPVTCRFTAGVIPVCAASAPGAGAAAS